MSVAFVNAPGQKAYAADVQVSIGMLSMQFDLVPQARSKGKTASEDKPEPKSRMVCPDQAHDTPVRVEQKYHCPDGHGPYFPADVARALETEDGLVFADKDAVAEAKSGGAETGVLDLRVHPAEAVAEACRPGEKGYRLRPAKVKSKVPARSVEMYGVLRDLLVARPDIALVGRLLLRGKLSFYRMEVWGGQLMLSELVHPDDLADRDSIEVEVREKSVADLGSLLEMHMEEWEPELHRFDEAAALAKVAAAASGEAPGGLASVTSIALAEDIGVLLERALAARQKEVA